MLAKLIKIVWGTPVRKVVTLLTGLFVLPAWVFNYENWLQTNGYDALLTDPKSPVLAILGQVLAFVTSTELRAAVFGAAIALVGEGLWRWNKRNGAAAPEASADNSALVNEHIASAYKTIGMAIGAEQPLQYDLAMTSIEPLLLDLSRQNEWLIPNLRSDGTEAGVLRALCYLNALTPALVLGDGSEARKRANEIVPELNGKSADALREELGISRSPGPPVAEPEVAPKAIAASSLIPANKPYYEYPKAVVQIEDFKISRHALPDGQLEKVEGRVVVKSHCYTVLRECEVRAVSLASDGIETTLNGQLFSGRRPVDRQETGLFLLPVGGHISLPLIFRDLKDTVSKPPFLLRLVNQKVPLAENTSYILTIDLHSEAQDVARARVQIDLQSGPNFSLTLLHQAVRPR